MYYDKISYIRSKFVDEESKKVFDARLQYAVDGDDCAFFDNIRGGKCFRQANELETSEMFEEFFKENKNRKIIIYGAGYIGRLNKEILDACGYEVFAYGDSNSELWGNVIKGIRVFSDSEIVKIRDEAVFVVSGRNLSAIGIYRKLLYLMQIDKDRIYLPRFGGLSAVCGQQYFDFFEPKPNEVFVDAGAYNGQTSVGFSKWCPDFKDIYMFEPDNREETIIKDTMKNAGIENYHLLMKGVSDHNKSGYFCEDFVNMSGGRVSFKGNIPVPIISLDETIRDRITFIKMDIEGEERNALLGAENLIKAYKPRLAICVYHRIDDFLEIPELILKFDNEYEMALRHYASNAGETVLYAW